MENKEETNQYLKLIVKSSTIVFIGVILSKIISYIYKIIIARNAGPEIYGLFSIAIIVVGIFSAFASLGLTDGLLRYISFYRGKREGKKIIFLIKTSLIITSVTSIVSAIIMFFLSDFIALKILNEPGLSYFLKTLAFSIPIYVLLGIVLVIIRAFEKITAYTFLVNILHNLLKLFFLVCLLLFLSEVNAIIFSYIMASFFVLAVAYILYTILVKKEIVEIQSKGDVKKEVLFKMLSFSWPLVFSSLLLGVFFWVDSLMIGYFLSAKDVGVYNAAVTLIGLFSIAQDLFMQIFLPIIPKELARKKTQVIKELSKQIFKWTFIINLPLAIMLLIFPEAIINLFFGEQYIAASYPLAILSIGALFSGFMGLLIGLISMKGKTKTVLSNFIIFIIINIFLNFIFIPKYGLIGAAIATAVTWVCFTITLLFQVKAAYGFYPLRRKIANIAMVSIIPIFFAYYMARYFGNSLFNLIFSGICFTIIYFGLIVISKALDGNDLEAIKNLRVIATSRIRR